MIELYCVVTRPMRWRRIKDWPAGLIRRGLPLCSIGKCHSLFAAHEII